MNFIRGLDESLFFWINNGWATPSLDIFMTLVTIAGDAAVWIALGLLFIAFWDRPNRAYMIKVFILTILLAGLSMQAVKFVTDRDRPLEKFKQDIVEKKVVVNAPFRQLKSRSFPSGHSQAAFTAATFFALYYKRWRIFLYGFAALVALSRVYLGVHFPADILVGSIMGWFTAWIIWRLDPFSKSCLPKES